MVLLVSGIASRGVTGYFSFSFADGWPWTLSRTHGISFWIEWELLSGGRGCMVFVFKIQNQLLEVELKIFRLRIKSRRLQHDVFVIKS